MSTIADGGTEPTGIDWDSVWRETAKEYRRGMAKRVLIGTGETVSVTYAQSRARAMFLGALNRLAPHVVIDLLQPQNFDLFTQATMAVVQRFIVGQQKRTGDVTGEPDVKRPMDAAEQEALDRHRAYILQWQDRHHLTDDWLTLAAIDTTVTAAAAGYPDSPHAEFLRWFPDGMPLLLSDTDNHASLHDGRGETNDLKVSSDEGRTGPVFHWVPPHKMINVPIYLDDLKYPEHEYEDGYIGEDEGDFGYFDPRTETVDGAVKRLLPVLESRLRRHLETIVAEDRTLNDALKPVEFRKVTAFEWLVQFQVLGESRRDISQSLADARLARDPEWEQHYRPDFYKSHVGREIRRVADLIGLTLRDA